MVSEIEELVSFLKHDKVAVRMAACQHIASMTESVLIRDQLMKTDCIKGLLLLCGDELSCAHEAAKCLINLCEHEAIVNHVVSMKGIDLLMILISTKNQLGDLSFMILSNITRFQKGCEALMAAKDDDGLLGKHVSHLVRLLTSADSSDSHDKTMYIATILMNLSKVDTARRMLLNEKREYIPRLLPLLSHSQLMRRAGVAGMLKNCLFTTAKHEWLVGDDVDILPYLMLPLIAGTDEFRDNEMDNLPAECQYLDEDKARESDPEVRKLLVESIFLLTAFRESRNKMREIEVYAVLRNLDLVEEDEEVKDVIERTIGTILLEEGEEGRDNPIPDEIVPDAKMREEAMAERKEALAKAANKPPTEVLSEPAPRVAEEKSAAEVAQIIKASSSDLGESEVKITDESQLDSFLDAFA
eukprot:TRINITY_DN41767_c0_g1_i1.p1 TRINITY_DN41767_c0_g1~~TRINITY_DN41767_c0_g1_i1.p1  ORF type:complete len:414 (-),score=100.27 TRINITY_DN41767_c0_g1_i1:25-1266(-)